MCRCVSTRVSKCRRKNKKNATQMGFNLCVCVIRPKKFKLKIFLNIRISTFYISLGLFFYSNEIMDLLLLCLVRCVCVCVCVFSRIILIDGSIFFSFKFLGEDWTDGWNRMQKQHIEVKTMHAQRERESPSHPFFLDMVIATPSVCKI